jgi:hypothetical protein
MQFRSSADISAGLPIGSGWRTFALIKCIWRRPGSPGLLPVKLTVELPAAVHRDLVAYAEALGRETGQPVNEPAKLIAPMLARFIASDRAFAKARNVRKPIPPPANAARSTTSTEPG